QCCDLGYHASLNRALRTFLSAELNLEQSKHEGLDAIENAVENLDATSDKQRLMEMYNNVFCPPMKFEFQPHMGDMASQLCAQQPVQSELVQRCQQLQSRLSTLKIENEEVKKTMEATLQTIQDIVTVEDFDVSDCFQYSNSMESVKSTVSETFMSKPSIAKRRANQQETEQFYFTVRGLSGSGGTPAAHRETWNLEPLSNVGSAVFEYLDLDLGIFGDHSSTSVKTQISLSCMCLTGTPKRRVLPCTLPGRKGIFFFSFPQKTFFFLRIFVKHLVGFCWNVSFSAIGGSRKETFIS
ncbi:SLIT-ROBO Rho GTPase-activating protein 2C-like, partial [Leptonychotes weddellii]|uniref:SLIT-ROBO Rho GTPase-activating protein 2C-like n=1 Tax=Leptonychotes weddellii TaxID=9713 RepID=A0A7F8RNZ1_LEPWE